MYERFGSYSIEKYVLQNTCRLSKTRHLRPYRVVFVFHKAVVMALADKKKSDTVTTAHTKQAQEIAAQIRIKSSSEMAMKLTRGSVKIQYGRFNLKKINAQ